MNQYQCYRPPLCAPAVCWLSLGMSSGPLWISLFCMAVSKNLKSAFLEVTLSDFASRRLGALLGTSGASRRLRTNIIDLVMNSVVLTMNQYECNTNIIAFVRNGVVFTMNQYSGNTSIIAFTMNSDVSTMNQHPCNTYIIDFIIELASRQYISHWFYKGQCFFYNEVASRQYIYQ